MKHIIYFTVAIFFLAEGVNAQGIRDLLNKVAKKDSSGKTVLNRIGKTIPGANGGLSNDDIVNGLKEALRVGTDSSAKRLAKTDGFFGDLAVKILMPDEAKKAEKTLRGLGMGKLVDKAILSMNRAAEDAAMGVGSIFWNSIRQMSISDGLQVLRGGDFAATDYLRKTTTADLTNKFRPVIEASLAKVDATRYWKEVFTAFNRFSSAPVNTDLTGYVTEMALKGLFLNISLEEQKIRKDPAARVNDILKKVFGGKLP